MAKSNEVSIKRVRNYWHYCVTVVIEHKNLIHQNDKSYIKYHCYVCPSIPQLGLDKTYYFTCFFLWTSLMAPGVIFPSSFSALSPATFGIMMFLRRSIYSLPGDSHGWKQIKKTNFAKVQKLELFPIFVVNALTIAFKICLTLDVLINPFAHIECSIDTVFLSLKLWVNYFVLSLLTNGPFCLIQLSFSYFKLENSSNPTN